MATTDFLLLCWRYLRNHFKYSVTLCASFKCRDFLGVEKLRYELLRICFKTNGRQVIVVSGSAISQCRIGHGDCFL
jgi:hypothetical protein